MRYGLYTPPGWNERDPLPLVVFLHSSGNNERALARSRVTGVLDDWIEQGRIAPFILVAPDGERGFWENWHDGSHRYQDYVVEDLIPLVRQRYPVRPGRENTHLLGVSMGGAGTLYMALDNLDRFASAAVISAPLFDVEETIEFLENNPWPRLGPVQRVYGPPERQHIEERNAYARIREPGDLSGLDLLLAAGTEDSFRALETTRDFHTHLTAREVPHRYLEFNGGHTWSDWRQVIPVMLCLHNPPEGGCELPEDPFYRIEAVPADAP